MGAVVVNNRAEASLAFVPFFWSEFRVEIELISDARDLWSSNGKCTIKIGGGATCTRVRRGAAYSRAIRAIEIVWPRQATDWCFAISTNGEASVSHRNVLKGWQCGSFCHDRPMANAQRSRYVWARGIQWTFPIFRLFFAILDLDFAQCWKAWKISICDAYGQPSLTQGKR